MKAVRYLESWELIPFNLYIEITGFWNIIRIHGNLFHYYVFYLIIEQNTSII